MEMGEMAVALGRLLRRGLLRGGAHGGGRGCGRREARRGLCGGGLGGGLGRGGSLVFFKQKTAYEITYGDWSSDVCSSDLETPCGTPSISAWRLSRVSRS